MLQQGRQSLPVPDNLESGGRRQGILILPALGQVHRLLESLGGEPSV